MNLWGYFVGRVDMLKKLGVHLSGMCAAVFADELSGAVDSGMGSTNTICISKHYLH